MSTARTESSPSTEGTIGMGVTVLVVEDNSDSAQLVRHMLEPRGFAVEIAPNGIHALEVLARMRPQVILLDIMMPEMSGMEVLDHIRSNPLLADIPTILVTAKAGDDDLLEGYKFGADYYIAKPFTARQLMYGIGLVLGREFLD